MTIAVRQRRIFIALLLSMMVGIAILKSLGTGPVSVDAFCLYDYYQLEPVEKVILPDANRPLNRWKQIEVFLSVPEDKTPAQPTDSAGINNCHFIICNGTAGGDGQIIATEKWHSQRPLARSCNYSTIYVCVITNSRLTVPSDLQITRTEDLTMQLARMFDIDLQQIHYPSVWR